MCLAALKTCSSSTCIVLKKQVMTLTLSARACLFNRMTGADACRVTNANKREYVNLIAQHRMTTAIRGQINSFLAGFWDLIPKVTRDLIFSSNFI